MPRKTRVVQNSRHATLGRAHPGATLEPSDCMGHLPDHADAAKAIPSSPFFQHATFQVDEKAFRLSADAELYDADETAPPWADALEEDDAREARETVSDDDDLVRRYLSEMGGIARLTPAEEVALAKRIEQGPSGRGRHLPSLGSSLHKRTQAEVENQETLWIDRLDSKQARAHMIRANLRLVVSIAKQFSGRGLTLLDLIQEGNLGLMKAVDRFDWRRGCRFGTYASWWIKQSMSRAISDQGRVIRLPAHIGDSISRVQRMRHMWLQLHGWEPTAQELSESAQMSEERLAQIEQLTVPSVSLDWVLSDGERTVADQLTDETCPPHIDILLDRERDRILHRSLRELSTRERRVLCMHFGIGYHRAYTLEEIGRKFRLTRERIRQIEVKALQKLRHPSQCRLPEEYSDRPRPPHPS